MTKDSKKKETGNGGREGEKRKEEMEEGREGRRGKQEKKEGCFFTSLTAAWGAASPKRRDDAMLI